MPNFPQRQAIQSEEMREAPMTGPWGGIQSELPPSLIESLGVLDAQNIIFQRGLARARAGLVLQPAFPEVNKGATNLADFYNISGVRVQVAFTDTIMRWSPATGGGAWVGTTGPTFGGSGLPFTWAVLNQKLAFSQGALQGPDQNTDIMLFDGVGNTYVSAASGISALSLAEVDNHLVAANTIEGGVQYPQRYHWSGIGDSTDWTSFSSGINDYLCDLGPVYGVKKLGQYGYGHHAKGIIQLIPTGVGTAPFAFVPLMNTFNGLVYPFSLDSFNYQGTECSVYAGSDNIYIFNQSSVIPIGDAPFEGRKRSGARSRIMADCVAAGSTGVVGFISQAVNGDPFLAYWLLLRSVNEAKAYVYNFDEGNWSIETFAKSRPQHLGRFIQNPLTATNDLIGFCLGVNTGGVAVMDNSISSEENISLTSGKLIFEDRRHKHTEKKVRVVVNDQGACTYSLSLTNEQGVTQSQSFLLGNGSGDDLTIVLPFTITGLRIQWVLSALAGQPFSVVEVAPIFDVGGEQRSGTVDAN